MINAWHLKKSSQPGLPFAIYTNNEKVVIISGVGKTAMAGAVCYTLALFGAGQLPPVLLNLGIAGHRSAILGGLYLANKIVDNETGRVFYPQLPMSVTCKTKMLATHSKPNRLYAEEILYDMEASGFYEMAVKFSSSELIHAVKIVSDNKQSSIANINESQVEDWIVLHLTSIEALLQSIQLIRKSLQIYASDSYTQLQQAFRFTVSGEIKLKALLKRWQVLNGDDEIVWQNAKLKSGKEFLVWLEQKLDKTAFYL